MPFLKTIEGKFPNCLYAPKWASCGAPTKLSDAIRLSLFVDFAEGWLNNARANEVDHLSRHRHRLRRALSDPQPAHGLLGLHPRR